MYQFWLSNWYKSNGIRYGLFIGLIQHSSSFFSKRLCNIEVAIKNIIEVMQYAHLFWWADYIQKKMTIFFWCKEKTRLSSHPLLEFWAGIIKINLLKYRVVSNTKLQNNRKMYFWIHEFCGTLANVHEPCEEMTTITCRRG